MKLTTAIFAFAAGALAASPALAASDVFIKFDGVDGEAAVAGWSFGACNAGQCTNVVSPRDAASGQASGKAGKPGKPSTTTWDIKKVEGARTAGGVRVAVGDLDGDGRADLAYAGTLDSVQNLTLNFDKASPVLAKICMGKHFDKVNLRIGSDSYEITNPTISCAGATDAAVTTPVSGGDSAKQTPNTSFGTMVRSGVANASNITVAFSGGQMKHTKTGHVTLLK